NPNAYLKPVDLEKEFEVFQQKFGAWRDFSDFLSWQLYPKVFEEYHTHYEEFGSVRALPTPAFFFGLKPNEEILVEIAAGKALLVQYINLSDADAHGERLVFFRLNGQVRSLKVKDKKVASAVVEHRKVSGENEIGAPLQGSLARILVKEGDAVELNAPLFVIEAMKMESTVASPVAGVVKKIHLAERTLVAQDDLVMEIG
ncbi:MAG: biotin/lipoyl-containing protein, partial [Bacteroidota bacterium]